MAKGNALLLLGLVGAGVAAFALSGTATAAPATPAGGCALDPSIPPPVAQTVNTLLAAIPGSVPASAYTSLAAQMQAAGYPMAAACLNAKAVQVQPKTGGISFDPTVQQAVLQNAAILKVPIGVVGTQVLQGQAAQQAAQQAQQTAQIAQAAAQTQAQLDFYNSLVAIGVSPTNATQFSSNPTALGVFQTLTAGGMPGTQAAQIVLAQPV